MDELARLLAHERRLLELLLFKLVEGRHLLAAGEARFLPYAVTEVERAVERVQEAELRRAMLIAELAADLDVSEDALAIGALAESSVEPYRTIFADHHKAFLELAAEIEDETRQNRRLAERGVDGTAQLMAMLDRSAMGTERWSTPRTGPAVMDLQMAQFSYQAVLGATARLTMPSVVNLLR